MNFMQSTCVALWQHSEKDIFFFFSFQALHEARCLIRRFALLGGLMRLMGFICPESVVYISPPRGQGFTDTRCGNFTDSTVFLRKRRADGCETGPDAEFCRTLQSRLTFLWSSSRLRPHLCCFRRDL